jgi:hypothetical protein
VARTAKSAENVCSARHARLKARINIEIACTTNDNKQLVMKELVDVFHTTPSPVIRPYHACQAGDEQGLATLLVHLR